MQISRHWRLNSNRYRLEGVRYENGEVSLQQRPAPVTVHTENGQSQPSSDNTRTEQREAARA